MEIIELGNTSMVINVAASSGVSNAGVSLDIARVAGLPRDHHVITLPLEVGQNSPAVEDLRNRLAESGLETVQITLHGQPLPFPLVASLDEAKHGNDFGFTGSVINLMKAQ